MSPPPRKRVRRRLGRMRPRNWPVRWRLAAASASLTLAILLVFGAVIGTVAADRIRDDFDEEVRNAGRTLASELQVVYTNLGSVLLKGTRLQSFVLPEDSSVRVYDLEGNLLGKEGSGQLGRPDPGLSTSDGTRVETIVLTSDAGQATGYIQYGRSLSQVNTTIERLRFFIGAGVLGGALLAILAGVAIASRAMRPVSKLTATARQVADTQDPSRHMPVPKGDDEVGELALTLEQMLRSLDAARTDREAAMKKQREFVADASHELRTPLTSIIANLELLQASLQEPGHDEDREMAASALRSSRRMSRLVGDLLLLARADAGRLGERRRCDLTEIAAEAAAEIGPAIGDRELKVDDRGPLWVEGNPDELHRMVLNLLDNAVSHTPAASSIELRLRADDGAALVEVADDGAGIPPELRDQIFDRFVRGEGPADTATGPGTGLGLAIVRAVAISHGGKAEAGKSESGGALLRIQLPLSGQKKDFKPALDRL